MWNFSSKSKIFTLVREEKAKGKAKMEEEDDMGVIH